MQLVDHRGLADPGIAGDERLQPGRAARLRPGRSPRPAASISRLAAVERLGDQQPVGHVLRSGRERAGCGRAPSQSARQRRRSPRPPRQSDTAPRRSWPAASSRSPRAARGCRSVRSPGGVGWRAMWQWTHSMRIGGGEGQHLRQHLVEGDTQRIKIAARVDRAVHAAGLLRRHIGERAGDHLGRCGRLALARQPGRYAETRQPDGQRRSRRRRGRGPASDVLVDQAPLVEPTQCRCQADGARAGTT